MNIDKKTHRTTLGQGMTVVAGALMAVLTPGLLAGGAEARGRVNDVAADGRFCTATATALDASCRSGVEAEEELARAICLNLGERQERTECFADADDSSDAAEEECAEQLAARRAACVALGEDRYDPDFDPEDFDADFRNPGHQNPYFPIVIGYRWVYGGSETDTVEVLDRTKLIDGVTCVVSRDEVSENGALLEGTNDWFAQGLDGTVFYCGEETAEYETFAGDAPMLPELISNEGSFKWGRDGDKGGIIFPGAPRPGMVYREEFSLANAEDIARILTITYSYGRDRELDRLVPRDLARRLCAGDCVVTENSSLLSPGGIERKYYARGIGFFLEVHPSSRDVLQLTGCNFDPRCAGLPTP